MSVSHPELDSSPKYEVVTTSAGAVSIRHNGNGEIMHNPVGPWAEANALYVQPSRLAERLSRDRELVLFDVGLGAAANSVAAIACAEKLNARLTVVSFERDLELLQFALVHANQFPHLDARRDAIASLLQNGRWSSGDGSSHDGGAIAWELRHGDFTDLIEREPLSPHLVTSILIRRSETKRCGRSRLLKNSG